MIPTPALDHSRIWREHRYIYPVASRRARGISIGVNLNLDKICNFGCVYCEVNRGIVPLTRSVDVAALIAELHAILRFAADGSLAQDERFAGLTPPGTFLPLRDIAFSGDGEPTSFRNFPAVVDAVIAERDASAFPDLKLVVISNATLFHRPTLRAALRVLHDAGGEVWAKLDAGTADYFQRVDATTISYDRILANLLLLAKEQPIVVQTCLMRIDGCGPSGDEITAYIGRLADIRSAGGMIDRVQLYSVSRPPAERNVTMLPPDDLEAVRQRVIATLPDLTVERFDGSWE